MNTKIYFYRQIRYFEVNIFVHSNAVEFVTRSGIIYAFFRDKISLQCSPVMHMRVLYFRFLWSYSFAILIMMPAIPIVLISLLHPPSKEPR